MVCKDNLLGLLSFCSLSILAKFHSLEASIVTMKSQSIYSPLTCMQETWLSDESKLAMVTLDGYKSLIYSISQEICTRFCCALLCCGYAIVNNEFT